jgi:hypothetical protein
MGDGKLLEEAIFRNCQFLQVGRAETVSRINPPRKPERIVRRGELLRMGLREREQGTHPLLSLQLTWILVLASWPAIR